MADSATSDCLFSDEEPARIPADASSRDVLIPSTQRNNSHSTESTSSATPSRPLGQANLISSFASPPACTPDIPHQKSLWASLVLGRSRTRDTPLRFEHSTTVLSRSKSSTTRPILNLFAYTVQLKFKKNAVMFILCVTHAVQKKNIFENDNDSTSCII